jgi:hypothetical protein
MIPRVTRHREICLPADRYPGGPGIDEMSYHEDTQAG